MPEAWVKETRGPCPHCGVLVQFIPVDVRETLHPSRESLLRMQHPHVALCPSCLQPSVDWVWQAWNRATSKLEETRRLGIYPRARNASPPPEVPEAAARDYAEAVLVSQDSPRAAAALARRALQVSLRDLGFNHPTKKLHQEISLALADNRMPSTLGEKLRFVQGAGNDAAHPNLDFQGDLIETTPEDLTLIFAALDELFDAFYVKPVRHAAIMQARAARRNGP